MNYTDMRKIQSNQPSQYGIAQFRDSRKFPGAATVLYRSSDRKVIEGDKLFWSNWVHLVRIGQIKQESKQGTYGDSAFYVGLPKPPVVIKESPEMHEKYRREFEHKRKMRLLGPEPKICGYNAAACDM